MMVSPSRVFHRGSALLSVLAIVLIVTILLISFTLTARLDRQSTYNYTQGILGGEVADGAVREVSAALLQEIVAGSETEAAHEVDGVRIYPPLNPSTVGPRRLGYPDAAWGSEPSGSMLPPSLVRVSRSQASWPSPYDTSTVPENAASAVGTDEESANGRSVSAERWNKPGLLGGAIPPAFSSDPPDWIYVTREGGKVCTDTEVSGGALRQDPAGSNTKAVLGRYAYAIYDQGSLLDINIAGFPGAERGAAETGGKSSLAYADLTRLPGLSQSAVDDFVTWRNRGGLLLLGGFHALAEANLAGGNLTFRNGDNPLLNRQDLLGYLQKVVGDTSAAPYLSTLSLGVNAPSVAPAAATSQNPVLPEIRATEDVNLTRYGVDGSTQQYLVKKGEPFLQRRFPLERIGWLTFSGPSNASVASAIRSCFGLEWDQGNLRWNYLETANPLPSPQIIKTLSQVAQEKREPNFFELLKAVILDGSLGVSPGAYPGFDSSGNAAGVEGPAGQHFEIYSSVPDFQILQIGANIIDQADADSYPTRIFCNVYGGTRPEDAVFNSVFGVENLPYFHRLLQVTLATVPGDAGPPAVQGKLGAWLQPELWNPHRALASGASSSNRPSRFRVRTYGRASTVWSQRVTATHWQAGFSSSQIYSDNAGPGADFSKGCLYFSDQPTNSAFRDRPVALTTANVDATVTDSKCLFSPTAYPHITGTSNSFAGVFTGEANFTPKANQGYADPYIKDVSPKTYPGPGERTFVLECQDASGNWRPYTAISRFQITDPNNISIGTFSSGTQIVGSTTPQAFYLHVDPRTDRFSVSEDYPNAANSGFPLNSTIQPNSTTIHSVRKYWPRISSGFTYGAAAQRFLGSWQANLTDTFYADRDGVVRPADGFRRNMSTGDGCLTFHGGVENARRPIVLDRPFRSVAELGYVFRDQPYKTLDFWTEKSADAGLLDVFTTETQGGVVMGQVNINRSPPQVLEAILAGAGKSGADGAIAISSEAAQLSAPLFNQLSATPLINRSEIATHLGNPINAAFSDPADRADKVRAESVTRALAPVAEFRVWNLLIDVIAQSGRFGTKAATLANFTVESERRVWVHLAIDRLTGRILFQHTEPVYE